MAMQVFLDILTQVIGAFRFCIQCLKLFAVHSNATFNQRTSLTLRSVVADVVELKMQNISSFDFIYIGTTVLYYTTQFCNTARLYMILKGNKALTNKINVDNSKRYLARTLGYRLC